MVITRLPLVLLLIAMLVGGPAFAREYNKVQGIAPEQRVKIDKTIAKSKNIKNQVEAESDNLLSDGVTNTNCGELSIGNVEAPQKYGSRGIEVDRDIIITGDVINLATDCKRRPN